MNDNRINIIIGAKNEAGAALGKLNSDLNRTGKNSDLIRGSISLLGTAIAAIGVTSQAVKLVSITREFDKFNAGLKTATGSTEGAKQAFAAIQDFATETPYDLAQVTEAFTKLVNYGLTPSEKALTSYGNTASAMGKDLGQMIEAVADATTGEFERLKEFGIRASQEGDKVTFTFRGVSTTVKKSANEIENYLIKLGEANFADSMANRMSTLDGALSNLGDEWDKLFLNISQAGIGDEIAEQVRNAIGVLEELNAMIASGEIEDNLRAYSIQFYQWADDATNAIDIISEWFAVFTDNLSDEGETVVRSLSDSFENFPANVRAFVALATVYVAAEFDKIKARAIDFKEWFKATFTNFDSTWTKGGIDKQFSIIDSAKNSQVDEILAQRQKIIEASEKERQEAQKRRAEYDKEQEALKANTKDRLAQFKISAKGEGEASTETKKHKATLSDAEKAAKKYATELEHTLDRLLPLRAANQEYTESLNHLNSALSKGTITKAEYGTALENLNRQLADAKKQAGEYARSMEDARRASLESELSRQETGIEISIAQGNLSDTDALPFQIDLLKQRLALQQSLLADMQKSTPEEINAWNSQAEAIQRTTLELAEYQQRLRLLNPGEAFKQGLKDFGSDSNRNLLDFYQTALPDALNTSTEAISTFFRDFAKGNASLGESWKALGDTIEDTIFDIFAELLQLQLRMALLGGLGVTATGGVTGGGLLGLFGAMHSGGAVGVDSPTLTMAVPLSTFMDAPRFHTGLKGNEFPAILEDGESVLTKGQMAAIGKGLQDNSNTVADRQTINVQVNNAPSGTTATVNKSSDGMTIDVIVDALEKRQQDRVNRGYSGIQAQRPW